MRYLYFCLAILLAACSATSDPTSLPTPSEDSTISLQGSNTFSKTIAGSSDDALQTVSSGAVALTGTTLDMGSGKLIGLRFIDIHIPDHATITSAKIQFKVAKAGTASANLIFKGQLGNAPTFTTSTNNISSRSLTNASVSWSVPSWSSVGQRGSNQRTPNLAPIIQEVVSGSWNYGNGLVVVISGSGSRSAVSYNSSAITAPTLTVSYTTPSTSASFTAQQLHNSVGVVTHSGYDDTAYYDLKRVKDYVAESGITWVREGVYETPRSSHITFLSDLKAAGIKIDVGIGDPTGEDWAFTNGESAKLIYSLKHTYAGLYDQLEMPNEYDGFAPCIQNTGDQDCWINYLKTFYDEYYSALKNDPTFNNIRIVGPALAKSGSYQKLTADGISRSGDAANIHPYPGGTPSENLDILNTISSAKTRTSTHQVVASEFGYHNAIHTSNGNKGVPEDIAAHYILRSLIWNFANGVDQNYIYQLFDQKPDNPELTEMEAWYGLVAVEGNLTSPKENWALRRKPAFYAVKRFNTYLKDLGTGSALTQLPFKATLPNLPTNIHVCGDTHVCMYPIARKDGTYDIAMWLDNELWDRDNGTVVTDQASTATLIFDTPSNVSSYRPSVSSAVAALGTGVIQLDVTIDGKVTFFRVRP